MLMQKLQQERLVVALAAQAGAELVLTARGYGYMLEYPISRAYMDAGTNEVMKMIIAKQIGL